MLIQPDSVSESRNEQTHIKKKALKTKTRARILSRRCGITIGSLVLTEQQFIRHPGVQKRSQMVCVRFYYSMHETKQSKCRCRPKLRGLSPNEQEMSAGRDDGAH